MKFIQGKDREQVEFFSLSQLVTQDNEARLIDLFVGTIKLSDYGFKMAFIENGRPAYHPSDLLKLFIYGYMNRIRSSRQLEKECKRNLELMWLMKGLAPDHNTIANFRKDNPPAPRDWLLILKFTLRYTKGSIVWSLNLQLNFISPNKGYHTNKKNSVENLLSFVV